MRTYTTDQIEKLMAYRAKYMDKYVDDIYSSEKGQFEKAAQIFTAWLRKMETQNKIDFILTQI